MKQKIKRFLNSKAYMGFVCCCAFAAIIGVGISSMQPGADQPQTPDATITDAEQEPEVAQVDANKNAPATAVLPEQPPVVAQGEEPQDTPQEPPAEEPAGEPTAEAPAADAEDGEYEAAATMGDTVSFSWPVDGAIVMDFSTEAAIYDPTLDQYRTNDSVAISAPVGSDVKAAAAGTVASVTQDSENGVTIVINHQNGWKTTYSQLQADVAEGESVAAGQVIGSVVEPTMYGVALGSHLDFAVSCDDVPMDPTVALAD